MPKGRGLAAVIISFHGREFIADCLNTLKADLVACEHEIIIVDNHSTDGTVEYIEANHPDVTLIRNDRNRGFARAVNQGIEAAHHELLWLLNQDIRIRPGCLAALLDCHDHLERPGVIGPMLVGFDGLLQRQCRRFPRYRYLFFELTGLAYLFPRSGLFNGWKMGEFDHTTSRPVDQPMGAAMLVARRCIDQVGALDESFGVFFNDVDLCRRLHQAGYTNYYCAQAVIEHFAGGSVSRRKPKMVWLSHLGLFRYLQKWERRSRRPAWLRLARLPVLYLTGLVLLLAAVPRSIYHYYARSIT